MCVWNLSSGVMLHRLHGHADVTYDVAWSESVGLLASCSHDGTVRTWHHDPTQPLSPLDAQLW